MYTTTYPTVETMIDYNQKKVEIDINKFAFTKSTPRIRLLTIAIPVDQENEWNTAFDLEEENINQKDFIDYLSKSTKK